MASSVEQKHQVFLSFRGEDTRNNFTSHLHAALVRKGIDAFIDGELNRGEEISHALLTAIEESKISVIILSKNYASSSWCLKELCKILECKNANEQKVVVPIFYHVDPSHVRNQKESFEEAFAKHQERFKDKIDEVERWRAALTEVGNLSGHHIKNDRPESKHIEEIVEDILKKLKYESGCYTKGLIGIDSRLEEIESLLCFDSADVRIVGIWGMGGIGKTTIAEVVYHQFFAKFEGYCFLANVKEKYGGVYSQEYLFSKIFEDRNLENAGTSSLPTCIIDRLRHKKVFIVLDDVNDSMQLDLLTEKHCFGCGSRIIVTSRDKQVLRSIVDAMYTVVGLNEDEALQLFCLHAFKQRHPKEDFMELSKKVIHYAEGVPLALKVLGSALYRRSKQFWVDELNKLKEIPNPKIFDILRIGFDGLDHEVQNIFLDIACFFKGMDIFERMDMSYITNILNGLYKSVLSGIDILIDKSLVTTPHNRLEMHDLVQQMGRDIVCRKPNGKLIELGKRSRLWNAKDICHILKNQTGTGRVTGLLLDMSTIGEIDLKPKAFKGMNNLRFLKFYYPYFIKDGKVLLSQGLKYLPDTLTFLHWDDYPSKSLPSKFCPENLVELCMPNSHVEKLWNGVQNLSKLKRINLSKSQQLIEIPDLSKATNLEIMFLAGCSRLVEVPSSIRYLNNFHYLCVGHVRCDVNIPSGWDLSIDPSDYCSNITKFPEIPLNVEVLWLDGIAIEEVPSSIGCLSGLRDLCLFDCIKLKRLPNTICKLKSLMHLNLSGCLKLESFPEIVGTMECLISLSLDDTLIEELPSSIENLVGLKYLWLYGCKKLKNLPSTIGKLQSLESLSLDGCLKFEVFPEILETMKCLKYLHLNKTSIEELPLSIEHLVGLKYLDLDCCEKLKNLPSTIGKLQSLEKLSLKNCSNITKFPEIPGNLESLDLSGTAIEQVPSTIECHSKLSEILLENCAKLSGSLPRCFFKRKLCGPLRVVKVSGFSKLEVIQEHLGTVEVAKFRLLDGAAQTGNMKSEFWWSAAIEHVSSNLSSNDLRSLLNSIGVSDSSVFEELPRNLEKLKYLRRLSLSFCNLSVFSIHFPCNLSALTELDLSGNNFETVPESFKQLWHLNTLDLSYCERLQSLPELPPHLKFLYADNCTLLEAVSGALTIRTHCWKRHQSFRFTNCTNLDQKAIWTKTQLYIQHRATEDVKCRNQKKHTFRICFPGSEIPEWFDFQSLGSCVTTQLPPHDDHKFVGFALCVVVAAFEDDLTGFNVKYQCRLKTYPGHCRNFFRFDFTVNDPPRFIGSDHVFLVYDLNLYRKWARGESKYNLNETSFEFFVFKYDKPVDDDPVYSSLVKKCGVCLLYAQGDSTVLPHPPSESESDAGECNPLMIQPIFPYDPTWLSLKCGVNNQDFVEPMVQDGTTPKRPRDDYCYDEAGPSKNLSSGEEEDPHAKRLKCFNSFDVNGT